MTMYKPSPPHLEDEYVLEVEVWVKAGQLGWGYVHVDLGAHLGLGRIVALYSRSWIRFIPDPLAYLVTLFLKRQCNRTLCAHRSQPRRCGRAQ